VLALSKQDGFISQSKVNTKHLRRGRLINCQSVVAPARRGKVLRGMA